MTKYVLSFDPGVRNMGVCALKVDHHHQNTNNTVGLRLPIIDWGVWSFDGTVIELVALLDAWMGYLMFGLNNEDDNDRETKEFIVVLERQPPRNRKTCRIQTVLETYFATAVPGSVVRTMPSNSKWKFLGRMVPAKYSERKKLAIHCCREMLQGSVTSLDQVGAENARVWLEKFDRMEKADDMADAYLLGQVMGREYEIRRS